jgi:hypothetical protein
VTKTVTFCGVAQPTQFLVEVDENQLIHVAPERQLDVRKEKCLKRTTEVKKIKTIHTSRTIMFAELEKVMHHSVDNGKFIEALEKNVAGKKSTSGVGKTANYFTRLYGFDVGDPQFVAFRYFWKLSDPHEKPKIAFVYAVHRDDILADSIEVVQAVPLGEKVAVDSFERTIEKLHPNQYSPNTKKSQAQNIASSWKQGGFIEGKVRNIRVQPEISYRIACFAFLLGYVNGLRGDFVWNSVGVKSLCLSESKLRELAIECAKRDLMQYQYAGGVTAISFNKLLTTIGIHAIQS